MKTLDDKQVANLLIFLNRVEVKGFNEISAMNSILDVLCAKEEPQTKKFT